MKIKKIKKTQEDFLLTPNFLNVPLFPPMPQTTEYSVMINDYIFTTGCSDGLGGKQNESFLKALDTRHFDLFCLIIDKFHRLENFENGIFKISYREILTLLQKSDGQNNIKKICDLLKDLKYTNIRIYNTSTGVTRTFNAISTIETLNLQGKSLLTGIKFHEDFVSFLDNVEKLALFKLSEKLKMPSKIAQAIYTFIPSRAVYRSIKNPFEINLTTLMQDLRLEVPTSKAIRKKIFTQHEKSIINQLDNALLRDNLVLRVELVENRDKTDYKFRAWTEKLLETEATIPLCLNENRKLFNWWVEGGRTKADYYAATQTRFELDAYEYEVLEACGLEPQKNQAFFELSKSLLEKLNFPFTDIIAIMSEKNYRDEIQNAFPYFCGILKKSFNIQPELF